jgi:hypothetical protein
MTNQWWQVDLGADADVLQLTYYPRSDCCSDRNLNIQMWIGSSTNYLMNTQCQVPAYIPTGPTGTLLVGWFTVLWHLLTMCLCRQLRYNSMCCYRPLRHYCGHRIQLVSRSLRASGVLIRMF